MNGKNRKDIKPGQIFFLASQGYRCIAHDCRSHGRSSQPWNGNDMDTYADDLAALVAALDLKDAIHVGHSPPDYIEDLQKFDVPTLIIHGDDDQIVPSAPQPCAPQHSSSTRR